MSKRDKYHVVPHKGGWQIIKEGSSKATSSCRTKKEAVSIGRKLARSAAGGQIAIHKRDGKIQEVRSYGHEPRTTSGKGKKRSIVLPQTTGSVDRHDIAEVINGIHVVARGKNWAVRSSKKNRISTVFASKHAAVDFALQVAGSSNSSVFLHNESGRIVKETHSSSTKSES